MKKENKRCQWQRFRSVFTIGLILLTFFYSSLNGSSEPLSSNENTVRQVNKPQGFVAPGEGISTQTTGSTVIRTKVATNAPEAENLLSVDTQIVVRLAEGMSPDVVAGKIKAQVIRRGPLNYATLLLTGTMNKEQALERLRLEQGVLGAEENQRRHTSSMVISESGQYTKQWSMNVTGVPEAWATGATGQGITIAIVDTGVDLKHPDLQNNIVPGYNALTNSTTLGKNQDNNGHGTHVAGIAAAELNGIGIVGVAYKANIMPIKAMDKDGEGYDDAIAAGIVWAADHGAQIINLSLGSGREADVLTEAVAYAAGQGVLLIAAAGNYDPETGTNPGIDYPAADPNVLAITATDQKDQIADFSATGPEVALAAPGSGIISTWLNSTYAIAEGTSMSAPFVAGVAALIWSQHPDWSKQQVVQALETGVRDLGDKGRDQDYGYGLVDVALAVGITMPLKELPAPAKVDPRGATVTGGDGQTLATLTIPAKAITDLTDVTIRATNLPGPLPTGVSPLSTPLDIEWEGAALQKMLSFQVNDARISATALVGLYRWNGTRWLVAGGKSTIGQISLGTFIPGVYLAGTLLPQQTERIAGLDAVETAIQVAERAYPTGADTLILARNDNFPDALAGVPLAYKMQAPILLTPSSGLTPSLRNEITKLAPKTIYLLGGKVAIRPEIEVELQTNYVVKRLAGDTCFGTAEAIAEELGTSGKAVITNGNSFSDALVIASLAAQEGEPILLTDPIDLPKKTSEALKSLSITQTLIIGGVAVINEAITAQLPNPVRLSGWTSYDTEVAVLELYPPTGSTLYLATGENYPDALTGSALAAQSGSSIVLVPVSEPLPNNLVALLKAHKGKGLAVLGGSVALPAKVVANIRTLLE